MGGTFNPPHFGHMFLANEVRESLNYDKIIFIPSSTPAHKITETPDFHRLKMVEIITRNYSWAEVSDCDIKRGGVTRTVDTLQDVISIYSLSEKPGFIIGDDLVSGFSSWKNPEAVTYLSDLIIGIRDGFSVDDFPFPFKSVKNRVFPLSSSEIRKRVYNGMNIDFLLPPDVIKYIYNNGLYRE